MSVCSCSGLVSSAAGLKRVLEGSSCFGLVCSGAPLKSVLEGASCLGLVCSVSGFFAGKGSGRRGRFLCSSVSVSGFLAGKDTGSCVPRAL